MAVGSWKATGEIDVAIAAEQQAAKRSYLSSFSKSVVKIRSSIPEFPYKGTVSDGKKERAQFSTKPSSSYYSCMC